MFFFFVVVVFGFCFFSRDIAQVVTGHPHTHLFCFSCSLLFCPAALVPPILAVRPASWRFFSGCHSGPRVFFGILLELTGLELARPFRGPFSWDARRQGCFLASFPWFVFSPFVLFCGFTRFARRPSQWLDLRQARGARRPPLARVRARGSPSEGGGLVPSCSGISLPYFVWQRVAGTLGRTASRALLLGRGRFCLPPQALFHTHVFVFPRPVFFFCFFCLRMPWRARSYARARME